MSKGEVTKKSGGIGAGIFLLLIGIGILWYNEGRTVKNQSTINEARKNYIQVKSDIISEKNEEKLVATKGKLDLNEAGELVDSKFGIIVKAAKMVRTVEMYQWKEECETDDNDKKNCSYEKSWESTIIDSSEFEEGNHDNPDNMPYDTEVFLASNVRMGAYLLPDELVKQLSCDRKKNNSDLVNQYNNSVESIKVDGNYLTDVKDNSPEIGDIRISYQFIDSGSVSVMAVQTGDTFEAYTSKSGKDVYKILKGNYTGAQILEKMTKSNKTWKWILRFVGILLTISAFSSMFSFITNLTDKIPVIGNIIGGATSIVSTILGLSLSLIIIAVAWFRYRPILSIILLVVVIALVVLLKFYSKNKSLNK